MLNNKGRVISNFHEVLEAARRGDQSAWSILYDSVAGQMLGYLRGRGAIDPEGLLGDAFLQISRNLHSFNGDDNGFRSWAFTVAHHRLIDERRRLSRRPQETRLPESEHKAPRSSVDVEREALEAVDQTVIEHLLETLSDDQRNVILLRILGGLSTGETAAALGKSEGTVRVLQHRALSALREQLREKDVTP